MCGIAGVVSVGGGLEVTTDLARRMASTLRHRGPDHLAAWLAPSGRCALGHARLSVIDLETGDQPLGNEDGSVQVVFNGEIYNFGALRGELRREGHVFRTESDTEVLVHGYESWGIGVVERLEGMFAFAIWDEARSRLVLARDRAGKKPLYYWRSRRGFAFSSEMKGLLTLPFLSDEVDAGAVPLYLAFGYVPGERTIYGQVRKLAPATTAVLEADGSFDRTRYWSVDFRPAPVSRADAVGGVRSLLEQAVRRRMEADVPLGAFLSGGVDSAAVVAMMSRLSDRPIKTFCIGFEDQPGFDETRYARICADRYKTEHTEFRVGAGSIDLIDELVNAYDEPFGDSSAIPTHIVSGLAREHVTVALTGDGGDELFAGYHRLRAMAAADSLPGALVRTGHALARRLPHNDDFRSLPRRMQRFFAAAADPPAARMLSWVGYHDEVGPALLAEDVPVPDRWDLLSSFQQVLDGAGGEGATPLSRALTLNFETYLPEDLLVKADRCGMAHGLELRSPFLDTDLVEFAARLPDRLKIRGRTLKWVLKESLRDLVPSAVLRRGKMGFGVPLAEWLRGPWRPLLEERLVGPGARIGAWVRPEWVLDRVTRHLGGRADHSHELWSLLTLDAWLARQARG